jgi:hypothetical protein
VAAEEDDMRRYQQKERILANTDVGVAAATGVAAAAAAGTGAEAAAAGGAAGTAAGTGAGGESETADELPQRWRRGNVGVAAVAAAAAQLPTRSQRDDVSEFRHVTAEFWVRGLLRRGTRPTLNRLFGSGHEHDK